jgi:hypothetical protein
MISAECVLVGAGGETKRKHLHPQMKSDLFCATLLVHRPFEDAWIMIRVCGYLRSAFAVYDRPASRSMS